MTLALASVILDTLPTIVIEDDPQLAQDIDSGQLEYYANGYRESPEIVAERAAEIPGARPRSLSAGLRHAWAFTETALETAERSVERQIARGLGSIGEKQSSACADANLFTQLGARGSHASTANPHFPRH